jgi:hypothetical protein
MGWVCGVNGGRETHTWFCYGNVKERDHLEDLGVSGRVLTLNLLTTTIVAPPSNASKWQMGINSAFKGLKLILKKLHETSGEYCH